MYEWLSRIPKVGDIIRIKKTWNGTILFFIPDTQTRIFDVKIIGITDDGFIGTALEYVEVYALNGEGISTSEHIEIHPKDILSIEANKV